MFMMWMQMVLSAPMSSPPFPESYNSMDPGSGSSPCDATESDFGGVQGSALAAMQVANTGDDERNRLQRA
jgi:hypothetical protein